MYSFRLIFLFFCERILNIQTSYICVKFKYIAMKKIIFIICLCVFGCLKSSKADTIYAEVNADTAFIMHDAYHTNCASLFYMEFDELNFHINVYEIDTAGHAFCHCYFNLMTKIGPLTPGNYSVDVYGKWRDDPNEIEWFGSTSFTIEGSAPASPVLLGNCQSDCFQNVGYSELPVAGETNLSVVTVNPNPVSGMSEIVVTIPRNEMFELKVFDATGRLVETIFNQKADKGNQRFLWDTSYLPEGFYMVQLSYKYGSSTQKVLVKN